MPANPGGLAHLQPLDLTLIVLYLIGITLFGLRFREKKVARAAQAAKSLQSYFLANNTIPWWAIALSIVSAETSTLTIISIPGVAFAGDFGFLQIVLGYMIGRIVVAALFLPRYFEGRMLTAYQLIDQRFGSTLHKTTAGLFLLTRAAAEGVRVFAVSIVVSIAIGTGDLLSIALITALTLLYTFEGGLAAVIWTDVVQMVIYVAGTVIALFTLGKHVPGGWSTIHAIAGAAGKFHMLTFTLNLTTTYTFWAGILGGTFLTMASHGTDQLMVQRMLAARSLKESRLALLSSGVVIFIQFAFFLLIGAGLYAFYSLRPTPFAGGPAGLMPPDRIFPNFIVHEMPTGIAGLLVAAILAAAMSNLSAALNSLSSTTVVDFYLPWRSSQIASKSRVPYLRDSPTVAKVGELPQSSEVAAQERNRIAKFSTVLWAVILFAVAAYSLKAGGKGHVVETGLSIASIAYGALLGVFLLGTLTRYATQTGAILGMIAGFAFNLALWLQPHAIVFGNTPPARPFLFFPKVAFTWYVFLGSLVTFAVGSLASLLFRKQSLTRHKPAIATVLAFAFLVVIPEGNLRLEAQTKRPGAPSLASSAKVGHTVTYDFTPISNLINESITAKKLPGAVVLIGHDNKIVFEQAYGVRKLTGEPGPDGKASPAEPMTEDTVFDMASLTKCLVTATAIMQLYEAGKLQFDDPIQKYLPAFNPLVNGKTDPERAKVTIRTLLTHYSGEAPDVDLKDPWGLAAPDEAEGIRRALTTPLKSTPGQTFVYSDINFILLGHLVATITGEPLNGYAYDHIFHPLGMNDTSFHAFATACGPMTKLGANILFTDFTAADHKKMTSGTFECEGSWLPVTAIPATAPTQHDNEGIAATNPDFDHLLRGTVHDPTTRRMGGVAGHAGLFSTAEDLSLYAQALLDKLTRDTGPFPLKRSTLQLMTRPEQPPTALPGATIFTPDGQTTQGIAQRGFGWDINTAFSRPRGTIFPLGSFGHTGFTGTSLWMDPTSNTYVILMANAIHPRGGFPITPLRGTVATAAARALAISPPLPASYRGLRSNEDSIAQTPPLPAIEFISNPLSNRSISGSVITNPPSGSTVPTARTLTGIDVLEQTHYAALHEAATRHANHLNLGLLTNQTGLDTYGHRTIDILTNEAPKIDKTIHLQTLFSPEHGISGKQDSTTITQEDVDTTTQLPIIGLYGTSDAKRRPSHAQLANLDAVVIDIQSAGVRFWTYDTATAYFLEASAREQRDYHHDLEIIILDRPNPIGGLQVQGPLSDPGRESYINYMPLPVRHGLTLGELARYINGEATLTDGPHALYTPGADPGATPTSNTPTRVSTKGLHAHLTVIPMQNWSRFEYFDETGLPWTNPSPNLRSVIANTLYPGIGLFDTSNLSVGRGTDAPFEHLGAGSAPGKPAWFDAKAVADCLNDRAIPGVVIAPTLFAVAEDVNRYPYQGQMIQGIHLSPTDRNTLDSPELAIEIMNCLHHLYPTQFQLARLAPILASTSTLAALEKGTDPHTIYASWQTSLAEFRQRSRTYLLYH